LSYEHLLSKVNFRNERKGVKNVLSNVIV